MELEEIRRLVDELDNGVSKENAKIGLYEYGGEDDGSWVVGTRNGYLRFAIEFLKSGVISSEPGSTTKLIDVDMQNLIDEDSTIDFTNFEVVEEFTKDKTMRVGATKYSVTWS